MWETVWNARIPLAAVLLFALGFCTLLLNRNLIKKIIGLNIMDTASYLLLTSFGYVEGALSPIIQNGDTTFTKYVNPLPAGLVLTGIVVSVSVTAMMLALTLRLYQRYKSLNVDEIYRMALLEHSAENERKLAEAAKAEAEAQAPAGSAPEAKEAGK